MTISELDAWGSLDDESEYIVSRTTMELLSGWIEELNRNPANERGTAFVTDQGQLVLHTVNAEELRLERDDPRKIYDNLKKHCVIESSAQVAELAPDRRELYIEFVGYHTLEAMCLAKDKEAVLWTDDFVAGSLVQVEFQVDRTWTQLQLKIALKKGGIDEDDFEQASAKLVGWKYINTTWSGRTLLTPDKLATGSWIDGPSTNAWKCLVPFRYPYEQKLASHTSS